jgi:hypothetical protein
MLKLPTYDPEAARLERPIVETGLPAKEMLDEPPVKVEAPGLLNLNCGVDVAV